MSHANNFGVLRIVLAVGVLWSHCYPLAGNPQEPVGVWLDASVGTFAVNGFFLISGYLVTQSWLRTASWLDYARKRVLRIYPGFLMAFAFTALLTAACAPDAAAYAAALSPWRLLSSMSVLTGDALNNSETFPGNPFPGYANGSLWTLQPELICYTAVLTCGLAGLVSNGWVLRLAAVACTLFFAVTTESEATSLSRLAAPFAIGAALTTVPPLRGTLTGSVVAVTLIILSRGTVAFPTVLLVGLAYLLFGAAHASKTIGAGWTARTDLSYGVYLYAFPVQQWCAWMGVRSPWLMFTIVLPMCLGLAFLSWRLIEEPALRMVRRSMPSHDRDATPGAVLTSSLH